MIRYTYLIICILLGLMQEVAIGQQYFIKSYAAENGLPTRIISDACQDKEGCMWFSSYLGISKYDGFTFRNYDTLTGLPYQHYRKIKCDEKGIIWALPFSNKGKIVFLKDNAWQTIKLPDSGKGNAYVTSFDVIYLNNSAVICVGTYDGFNVYRNNKWKHYSVSNDKSQNVVFNVTDYKGSFYLSTKTGIFVLSGETVSRELNEKINKNNGSIVAIKFGNPGTEEEKMWVLTIHSIGFYQNNRFTVVADNFLLDDVDLTLVAFIEISKSGNVIFGNNFSKYLLKTATSQIIPLKIKNGFSANGASSVFIDREDNMWFTDSRGIDKISNITLVNYFESSGLPENEVTAIAESRDGRYVLGHNNKISVLKNDKFKVIELPGKQNSLTRVLDIMKDNKGEIWFSANTLGVGRLTPNDQIQWYPSINGFMATTISQDNSGRIWIGSNSGLYYLAKNKIVEYEHNALFLKNGIRKIYPCYKGGVYVTGINGLWQISRDTVIKLRAEDESQQFNAFSYFKDKKGTEFVGTMNGLFYLNNGILKRYINKRLNITNPIYFIFQDNENFYWFGTNSGVYRWDGINDPEVFNTYNGLAGRETNRSAGLLDSHGRVWVGTDRGLSCFDPGHNRLKTPPPLISLLYTETSHGKKLLLNTAATIDNSDNSLSFQFRGISFVNEELLTYKYKLEGYDKDWREATQNMLDKIKYVNIKPGKYKFCVMAKNYSSNWSSIAYSKEILIKPPIYMSWWFILISAAAIFILLGISYSFISQRIINNALKNEISERKQAEEKLKESEQRLSFIIEGSSLGTWDRDLTTNIIHLNHLCSEMLGFTVEETESTPDFWINLIHPEDKELSKQAAELHLEGKTPLLEVEYRIRTKDGKYKWVQDRAMVVQRDAAGKPIRMSGTRTDITERKQVADSLQKSEERIRLLLASLPVAIFTSPVDPETDLNMITGNVKALTGFTEEEFLAEPNFWNKRIHPDDRDRVLKALKEMPALGALSIEYRWQLADGTYKWIHDQSIIKTNGLHQEYLGVFVDINDLKVAEQMIRNKNEQLSLINAEKDKLFSIISHDLRSPVSGFLGLTGLLAEDLEKISLTQLREIVSAMYTSAGKVNDLLNDLLEWSRLQRGLTVVSAEILNLKQISEECIALVTEQSGIKAIEINNEVPGELLVTSDLHMLQIVLRNLLSNAVKFTPKTGKVTLAASIENNQFARISVSDTGIGMNPDLKGKLFKVNEKTGRKGTGGEPSSGLGLILCKEFVEKQNGQIWVESEEGKGSTFHFTVPVGT